MRGLINGNLLSEHSIEHYRGQYIAINCISAAVWVETKSKWSQNRVRVRQESKSEAKSKSETEAKPKTEAEWLNEWRSIVFMVCRLANARKRCKTDN